MKNINLDRLKGRSNYSGKIRDKKRSKSNITKIRNV